MKNVIINMCKVKTNVRTVKSTNECVVIIKKYLYCIYVIMYSKNSISKIYCKNKRSNALKSVKSTCTVFTYVQ